MGAFSRNDAGRTRSPTQYPMRCIPPLKYRASSELNIAIFSVSESTIPYARLSGHGRQPPFDGGPPRRFAGMHSSREEKFSNKSILRNFALPIGVRKNGFAARRTVVIMACVKFTVTQQ